MKQEKRFLKLSPQIEMIYLNLFIAPTILSMYIYFFRTLIQLQRFQPTFKNIL